MVSRTKVMFFNVTLAHFSAKNSIWSAAPKTVKPAPSMVNSLRLAQLVLTPVVLPWKCTNWSSGSSIAGSVQFDVRVQDFLLAPELK